MNALANFGNLLGIDGVLLALFALVGLMAVGAIVFVVIMLSNQKRAGSGSASNMPALPPAAVENRR